jgi:hypothetical protein
MNGTAQQRQRTVGDRVDDMAVVVEELDGRLVELASIVETVDKRQVEIGQGTAQAYDALAARVDALSRTRWQWVKWLVFGRG